MKIIKKFWGVALIVILLSTMFVGAAAPVSAANYAFTADVTQPSIAGGGLAAMNILDVAQSGATMYATTSTLVLYKSVDSGATWTRANTTLVGTPSIVAVAPDNAAIVAYVDTAAGTVYLSNNGGVTFGALTAPGAALAVINSMSISPAAPNNLVAIGGSNAGATVAAVAYWTIGPVAPVWTALAAVPTGIDYTVAVAFSTNFNADACLLVAGVDNTTTEGVYIDVFSFNLTLWNPAGYGFPRTVVLDSAGAAIACGRADIVLDANFYVGDVSTQIGFLAAQITDSVLVEVGGIFRMDVGSSGTLTRISAYNTAAATNRGLAFNSVAWDGTNLMAGRLAAGPITVLRCSNALATSGWSFIPNSALGTPGTGTLPLVMFNGGVGFCFSSGTNNAVAKTTDLGKTFQATALVNSNFALITDYWASPDGTTTYVLADDGTDMVLWKKAATTWTRIAILNAATTQTWMVRADKDAPATIYLGRQGLTTLQKSTDGGVNWIARAASAAIQDFVVQDANTIFVATVGAPSRVVKSINGAFTWTPTFITFLAGTCFSLNMIADNQLVVGSTAGSVAYTADVVTWTTIPAAIGVGPVVATASGVVAGETIWAGDITGVLGRWKIGTSVAWSLYAGAAATGIGSVNGIAYANGILYVLDNFGGVVITPIPLVVTTPQLFRFLSPTVTIAAATDRVSTAAINLLAGTTINALQNTGSNNLVVRNAAATDTMQSYTDLIVSAAMAPAPSYPINSAIIGVNSIAGGVNAFNFMWKAPAAGSAAGYSFDLQVFMDELGVVPASVTAVAIAPVFADGATASYLSTILGGFGPVAGTTYYWRVRVSAGFPLQSPWSPMQKFSVQVLQAVVPEIGSPANGAVIELAQAAFSWTPLANVTSYQFQLDTNSTFLDPIIGGAGGVTKSAGYSLPVSIELKPGETYYWRVKALTPNEGEWSTVGNFTVAVPVVIPSTTTSVTTTTVAPTTTTITTIVIPSATSTVITIPPPEKTEVNPTYIWAIIIIGAVLVLAVIVLIIRTRRSV